MAVAAAAQIVGASLVELWTPRERMAQYPPGRTRNLTGYFAGVGQPNDHPVGSTNIYTTPQTTASRRY